MKRITNSRYAFIGIMVTVASLTVVGSLVAASYEAFAGGGGDYSQGHSATNSCGNEFFPINVLCSNTDSQVQGDENAVGITSLQEAASAVMDRIVDGFLTIKTAIVEPFGAPNPPQENTRGGFNAFLKTHGLIPENGKGGAFGYGVLTENTESGDGSIVVATTHAGVLDSETQNNDASNPIWHNHVVRLGEDTANCGPDPAVVAITWEQPGNVQINGRIAFLTNIPNTFTGTSSFNPGMNPELFIPGNDVQQVVSFKLAPVPETGGSAPDGTLQAVCVTDITPAENLIIR